VSDHSRIRHVPALDGLRGVALLGVLFFHAHGLLPGGYLGVDLFFVLSGYLITSLLLGEQQRTGGIDLSRFWVRRARRLFPALLSLMPAVALYARFVAKPEELRGLRIEAFATLAYVANWRTIFAHKSYWQLFASPSLLEHTWSLSIEEQFYVFWPLLVTLLLRRGSSRSVLFLALSLCALSMLAMAALFSPENTSRAYLGTDTRMAGILAGAALATVLGTGATVSAQRGRVLDALGVFAALGLAVAWWKLDGRSPFLYHGGFWLTELGALLLIACAVTRESGPVARILALRPLTWLGTVSYGVYLWHWPVNVYLTAQRAHLRGFWLHLLHFGVTFAIAIVSFYVIEQPIRTRGVTFGRALYIVPAAVVLAILLVVRGTYARQMPTTPEPEASFFGETVQYRIMMVGDSTANSIGWALRGIHREGVGVDLLGKDGCTLLADNCDGPLYAEHVKRLHPNASVLFVGGAFMHGFNFDGAWRTACHPEWKRRFETRMQQRLADLRAPSSEVWVATLPYVFGDWDSEDYRTQVDCINESTRKSAQSVSGVQVLDLAQHVCPKGICAMDGDGEPIRPDGVHYSVKGAHEVALWTLAQLQH